MVSLFCPKLLQRPRQWLSKVPSLGTTRSISASSHHSFELCLGGSLLYLDLFCACFSKMGLKAIASSLSFYGRVQLSYLLLDSGETCVYLCLRYITILIVMWQQTTGYFLLLKHLLETNFLQCNIPSLELYILENIIKTNENNSTENGKCCNIFIISSSSISAFIFLFIYNIYKLVL